MHHRRQQDVVFDPKDGNRLQCLKGYHQCTLDRSTKCSNLSCEGVSQHVAFAPQQQEEPYKMGGDGQDLIAWLKSRRDVSNSLASPTPIQ